MPNTNYSYRLINTGDQALLTLYIPGRSPLPAGDSHPAFDTIVGNLLEADSLARGGDVEAAEALAEETAGLFDVADTVARKFEALAGSERLTVRSGKVYLDGDEASNEITEHIISMLERGEDFAPLVRFYERLLTNPLGHAIEALYPWMQGNGGLTITPSGMVVGYKSVFKTSDPETGEVCYKPTWNGGGVVNGVEVPGPIFQKEGDVVEMARSIVLHAPSVACGEGLHIGTASYAFGFTGDTKLEVHFDPRDVVSVPNAANKIRVCRYTVVGAIEKPYTQPIVPDYAPPSDDEDEDRCECGEYEDECEAPYCESFDGEPEDDGWMGPDKPTQAPTVDDFTVKGSDTETLVNALDDAITDARDALGRWVAGRKSQRDPKTGRFSG